jgi:hypothetical protein
VLRGVDSAHRLDRVELGAHGGDVDVGRERAQAPLIEADPAAEKRRGRTEQDHPRVDAFVALDARNDLHDRVIKRARRGHGSPRR